METLTPQQIHALIQNGESETLEFKESFQDKTIETIGAFANTSGGTILLGVRDNGDICGISIGKKSIEDIANRIQEVTEPKLHPSISHIPYKDKSIIVIQIKNPINTPISIRGRYYIRSGRTNQKMSHREIIECVLTNIELSWDAQLQANTTLSDLDPSLISKFVNTLNAVGRRPIPTESKHTDILKKLNLMRHGCLTRAALLLFGKNIDLYFPSAFVKMGRFRTSTTIVDDREAHGALILQLDEVMKWFRERLITEFKFTGAANREVNWEYPLGAVREATINLLSHRDYSSGAHSQIRLYDEKLEFWNAGLLPLSLTTDSLCTEHDSVPRNKKIAEIFYYMGFIERWGSGTLRICQELDDANHPSPSFVSDNDRFKVYFYKTKQLVNTHGLELNDRQQLILNTLKQYGSLTPSELQEHTQIKERTLREDLRSLENLKQVYSTGRTTNRTWQIK